MVWRVLILFLGTTSVFADEMPLTMDSLKALLPLLNEGMPRKVDEGDQPLTMDSLKTLLPLLNDVMPRKVDEGDRNSNLGNLNALLPLLNEPASPQQKITLVNEATNQNVQGNGNYEPIENYRGIDQQKIPISYKQYGTQSNNHASDHCPPPNPYHSVKTLLSILGILLEFLEHSTEIEKAYTVCEFIKRYLEGAPPSQEKDDFMAKLRDTEERLLHIRESTPGDHEEYFNFHSPNKHKISIVFEKELPGVDQINCRETFGRLIQTAVNVYKLTAKHPQCQPSGHVDENLFYPDNHVKPQKPYQFVVIYQNPPISYYQPDYKGISIIPHPDENHHHSPLEYLFPNFQVGNHNSKIPNHGNVLQYMLPHSQSPNNPFLPLPQNNKIQVDLLALIRQYIIQHPNGPKNQDSLLELLNNLTGKHYHDHNPTPVNIPYDFLQNNPPQSIPHVPVNPGSHITHIYPFDPHHLPGLVTDQVKNHPEINIPSHAPTNPPPNNLLELLNNLTGKYYHDHNPPPINIPYDFLQNNPPQSIPHVPVNPGSHFTHIYPFDTHHLPGLVTDQVKNHPEINIPSHAPTNPPPNNGYSTVYVESDHPHHKPYDLNGELYIPDTLPSNPHPNNEYSTVYVQPDHPHHKPYDLNGALHIPDTLIGKLQSDYAQNRPELTLEILLSLLKHPEGGKALIGINQPGSQSVQYLQPNDVNLVKKLIELLNSQNQNPNDNRNYVVYGPDGLPVQQSLLDVLNPPNSGNLNPDYAALLKKLQQWLAVSNSNKLPQSQNKANVIELTYVLKRPKPLIYRPIYYVKYRMPYTSFIQNFQNLILKKPGLRSDNLYQELITVSNISDVSPSLRSIPKEEILKLVFGNGTLIDARVVDVPDSTLNEQLDTTRKINADVDPEEIEELSGNLGLNKSESESNLHDRIAWLRIPTQATLKHDEDLAADSIPTPPKIAQLGAPTTNNSVNESSPKHSNEVEGLPQGRAEPSHPIHVVPPIAYTKSMSNDWVSKLSP